MPAARLVVSALSIQRPPSARRFRSPRPLRLSFDSRRPTNKPAKSATGKKAHATGKAEGAKAPSDPGEAAFLRIQARVNALPAAQVGQPRGDARMAASFVLSDTVPRLVDRGLLARLAALPKAEFDHSALADLRPAAEAVLWTQTQLAQVDAGASGARLPVDLVAEASALRGRMLDVCAYHFRDDAALRAQVDDIRSGQGYLDLAEDLSRLAGLYRAQAATLKQDLRFYRAADATDAFDLSGRITRELRSQGPQAAREVAWRTFAVLAALYAEVARAAHFLLRDAGPAAFPPLYAVSRAAPKRRDKTAPAPPTPPAPPSK